MGGLVLRYVGLTRYRKQRCIFFLYSKSRFRESIAKARGQNNNLLFSSCWTLPRDEDDLSVGAFIFTLSGRNERDMDVKFVLSSIPLCDFILNYFACLFSCSYFFPRQKKIRSSPKRKKSISESVHSPQSWGLLMRKTDAELSVICDNSAFRIVLRTITIFLLTQACSMVRSLKSGFHFIGTVSCDILP